MKKATVKKATVGETGAMLHRLELVPLGVLEQRGWPDNPKRHDLAGVQLSIRRFGYQDPVLIEPAGNKVAKGHGRLEALRLLRDGGRPEDWGDRAWPPRGVVEVGDDWAVPVVYGPPLPDQREARAYVVADNRHVELGGWDPDELSRWLKDLQDGIGDGALDGVGYSADDLSDMIANLPADDDIDAEPQFDRAEELRKEWGVEAGQLWVLGEHRLLCGDSTKADDVARVMGGEKAAVCLTDPPYGLGGNKASGKNSYDEYNDSRANLEELARKWLPLARDVAPVVCFSPGVTNAWIYPEASWVMCWFYGGGQLRSSWGFNCWQPFLCYGKDPSLASGHGCRPDAVDMNTPANAGDIDHPCPKPTKLWAWLIERLSFDRTDTFYEPFSGSGTTIIACEQLGRKCRAIELSPGYVAVALQRFKDATGKTPTLVDEGNDS